ncbi:response regulator [Chitinimonas arctica]|uniref:histidine kinase n=1 Tax=Chitinimonas arctica TaxID=2594795 RepID=A0A516SLA6_9NEIS|nr:response regulator [Chitinimonas arctica]QDQ28944.1 response regulator [Chitinimonas arctica]
MIESHLHSTERSKQPRALVVDDQATMRQVMASQLRSLGIEQVQSAVNGAEALLQLRQQRFDFVLSDWDMPVMNGLELLHAMRQEERFRDIPFILFTAHTSRSMIQQAIDAGVWELLAKPFTVGTLEIKLANACRRRNRLRMAAPGNPRIDAAAANAQATTPTAAPERPTLLVVDDTPDNLRLMAGLFEADYRVRIAHNGEKALALCTSDSPPDLVLLDIMMPGLDGFEVARRLRDHPISQHIPVIFVTAMTDDTTMRRGRELGAVDFVTKPIDPDLLQLRVGNFMRYLQLYKQRQAEMDAQLVAARLREDIEQTLRHELKAPLEGISGLIEELAKGGSNLSSRQRELLRLIEQGAQSALQTADLSALMLDIENGQYQMKPEPVTIAQLLHDHAASARATSQGQHLIIAVDAEVDVDQPPPTALGDPRLCQAIIQSLLQLACDSATAGSRIDLQLFDETPLKVIISYPGTVRTDLRPGFFDKFGGAGRREGNGLAAYSARLLAEAQGGELAMAADDDPKITTLVLTLPRPLST